MRQRKASERLIDAAIEILVDTPGEVLQHGIRSERAIQIAKTSQTTFFRNYTKETFIEALLRALVATSEVDFEDGGSGTSANPMPGDARRIIRQAFSADFVGDDQETVQKLLAVALGRLEGSAREQLRRTYGHADALRVRAYGPVLDARGATVRRPFTVAQLATVLTALREGLHIRRLVDADAVPDWLYSETALALAIATLDMRHQHEHIDDVGDALNLTTSGSDLTPTKLPYNPRQAVLDCAAREFTQHSFYLATLEGIAEASGVPLDMLKRLFPTKAHIVIAALRPKFMLIAQGITDDLSLGTDHVTIIRRHLVRCARLTVDERPFMDSMIASVSFDTSGFADGVVEIKRELHFPSLIEPVIADGQRLGRFTSDQPASEFAAILTNTLFIRCFSRRTHSPEENAGFVGDLMLNGLNSR